MNPPTKINDAMLKMAEEIWPDGFAGSLDEAFGKEGVIRQAPWRGMILPEEREMIRAMTLAEMDKWQLKLVPREMPVEATKPSEVVTNAIQRGKGFKWLLDHRAALTPEGRAALEKEAEAEGYPFARLGGPCGSHEDYAHPSKSPFLPTAPHSGTTNPQDPHGLPQHVPGAKNDAGKDMASLLLGFSRALTAVAAVASYGARKYTRDGWEHVPDGITRYRDAEWRHTLQGQREMCDQESGLPHSWHRLWNCLAVLELELREEELRQQKEL